MKPTVGRIVHFYMDQEVEAAAIVTCVNEDGSLELCVFMTDGLFYAHDVEYTNMGAMGQWSWPPRA